MNISRLNAIIAFSAGVATMFTACSHEKTLSGNSTSRYDLMVNPMIGTDFTGNTYPGAQVPFGMVQLSPDNGLPGWDRIAGYFYPDSTIAGFSHTHLSGTGAGDLYDISFMPVILPPVEGEAPLGIHSRFSHSTEKASAGYYRVILDDYNIEVELTASERTGFQRYTFPGGPAAVILNLSKAMNWDATVDTRIEVVDSVTIVGYRFSDGWARDQRVYFASRFSRPFDSVRLDSVLISSPDPTNNPAEKRPRYAVDAVFEYNTEPGEQLVIATALSGVSVDGAMANLKAEVGIDYAPDFDTALAAAQSKWNDALGRIDVKSSDAEAKEIFYTALYHSMLAPTLYDDVDGSYYGPDKKAHTADGWHNYSTFSLWDTFRASMPLFTIIEPERVNDMVKSFLAFYDQNGRLPVWNMWGGETDMMIGYHSVPVIADAYLKGIGDFDVEKALEAALATSNMDSYRGIGDFKRMGYIPYDVHDPYNGEHGNWSLSRTLEYAYDDYCIARMAERMGHSDVASQYYDRARNYVNLFDTVSGFMVPRDSKGRFQPGFDPDEYTPHICESNGWHYLWSVQHDIEGLMALLGGRDSMEKRLDTMFDYTIEDNSGLPIFSTGMIGQYAHGNEPSHHVPYLYNYVGTPSKTQHRVAQIRRELYNATPAGICGNDDTGQMSAWYVLSALGFYPVDPASGIYEIGTPLFPEMTVNMPSGKILHIKAPGVDSDHIYVKSVTVNGSPLDKSYITHEQLISGGDIVFEMSDTPQPAWWKL